MEPWQRDSYAWEDEADVLACAPDADGRWRVLTTPTVLYPTGGGQPHDTGTIAGVPVVDVRREAGQVVHLTDGPVPLGRARVTVDAARRLDHMQQHTGQHLLTALFLARHGVETTSFHLGPQTVAIELATRLDAAFEAAMEDVEATAQAIIAAGRPVSSHICEPDELAARGVRSRGLPEGFAGRVRLIEIGGVDLNTCGGTHVRDTASLGVCKLLEAESVGARGTRLYFVFGERVRRALGEAQAVARPLTRLLSVPPSGHVAAVERLQDQSRSAARRVAQLEEQLAAHVLAGLLADGRPVVTASLPDADARWLGVLAARFAAAAPERVVVLVGPERGGVAGPVVMAGPPDAVRALGPRVGEAVQAKGGGGSGRWQGRGQRLDRLDEALGAVG
jgi:misacylated tRNA(Ala) deacylase